MKKILLALGIFASSIAFADNTNMSMSDTNNNSNNSSTMMSKPMYFDFGLGVGNAAGWTSGVSPAINAMTMGFDINKNLAVEVGMDALPDGDNAGGQAMIMTYHMAAKGILPLTSVFSLYGKAGLGVNQYEGETPSNGMNMANQVGFGLYYAGGMSFNINQNFAIYLEGSGVAVPNVGNNGNQAQGSFGSTYMATTGLEVTF